MNIYLVSLEQDHKRRALLKDRFPRYYGSFIPVVSIDGRNIKAHEYFNLIKNEYKLRKKIKTPGEIGCSLSHINALEKFLETQDDYALILEDDVLGSDAEIDKIIEFTEKNKFNGIFHCGGQQGVYLSKYVFGKKYKNYDDVYTVPSFSINFVLRTCCYAVNRDMAAHIIQKHKMNITIADEWFTLFQGFDGVFIFSNILGHPNDYNVSHIQIERENINEKKFWKRNLSQGILRKIFNRIRNDFYKLIFMLLGYKKILEEDNK